VNPNRKIPRASNSSRVFGPDDPRMEANSRRVARDQARETREAASQPKGVSAESGDGDRGVRVSANGTDLGRFAGIDLTEGNGIDLRLVKIPAKDKVIAEMSLAAGDYGDIVIGPGGGTISVNDAVVLNQGRLGLADIAYSADAGDLLTGIVDQARLGSGTADATTFLRGDKTWAIPGGLIFDGLKGEILVSSSSSLFTIEPGVVSTTKMGGDVTVAGKALLTAADASAQRSALSLASVASSGSASDLTTGTVATARLGSGTANNTTFLRGDNTWAVPAGGGGGASLAEIRKAVSLRL